MSEYNKEKNSFVYSTADTTWSAQELHELHKALTQYPTDQYDNITRYIKIAATLPGKSIRDVAVKIRMMQASQEKGAPSAKRLKYEQRDLNGLSNVSYEDQISNLLQDNVNVLNTIRSNLVAGDLNANLALMVQFRDSCHSIFNKYYYDYNMNLD
ncbi:hypothetical protein THRCLA_22435 [Thraustotheca clavata]|uniref:Myb-like domain-containing protein n=1 Tax=Thraustotheca clavata TaxID=74557 RepID=A0A1V9Z1G6_9STRA|nr:hypothetical protein THRCLA_22435 [Thraustotheca clavata]